MGKVEDGILYARGVCDEKGSTPGMVHGLAIARDLGLLDGSSAAAISSTQSAPMMRASSTSRSPTVKSLRMTGNEHAARAAWRSAIEPPKCSTSVSTDRHAAPPRSYDLAISAGSRSALRSPFDGERRLISAITPRRSRPASAARKPRVGGICRACSSSDSMARVSVAATARWRDPIEDLVQVRRHHQEQCVLRDPCR